MVPRPLLALSLSGLDAGTWFEAGPRGAFDLAAGTGVAGVVIDATRPGLRPRDLDRSGRRDLAATLRRLGLAFAGIDLLIPPDHYSRPETADRALAALRAAAQLAAEMDPLAGGPRTLTTSIGPIDAGSGQSPSAPSRELMVELARIASVSGVRIGLLGGSPMELAPWVGKAIDPAASLLAGTDPSVAAARAGAGLVVARLSDVRHGARVEPGTGSLDELAYVVALATAGYGSAVVLDLRSVADQALAASRCAARWSAGPSGPGSLAGVRR